MSANGERSGVSPHGLGTSGEESGDSDTVGLKPSAAWSSLACEGEEMRIGPRHLAPERWTAEDEALLQTMLHAKAGTKDATN
jgi:hypothetical protein